MMPALTLLAAVAATLEREAAGQELVTMEPVSIADGHSPRARKTLDPRLERLVPGTWIEVGTRGDDGPLRCRLVVLVGTRRAIHIAINNDKVNARHTALDYRLRGGASDTGAAPALPF